MQPVTRLWEAVRSRWFAGRLHRQARELAKVLGQVRHRHAKRREALERRGSVLEG